MLYAEKPLAPKNRSIEKPAARFCQSAIADGHLSRRANLEAPRVNSNLYRAKRLLAIRRKHLTPT